MNNSEHSIRKNKEHFQDIHWTEQTFTSYVNLRTNKERNQDRHMIYGFKNKNHEIYANIVKSNEHILDIYWITKRRVCSVRTTPYPERGEVAHSGTGSECLVTHTCVLHRQTTPIRKNKEHFQDIHWTKRTSPDYVNTEE